MQIDQLILGKYRLLEYLNSGGFSSVFRAREEMTNREVAIKALAKTAYPASRMKFLLTEFQAMSKIWGHPNIVSIHTVEPGEEDYVAWIVMEFVEGKSLHELMQEGRAWTNRYPQYRFGHLPRPKGSTCPQDYAPRHQAAKYLAHDRKTGEGCRL